MDDRIEPIEVDAIFHLPNPGLYWSFCRSLWVMEPRFLSSDEKPGGSQSEPQVEVAMGRLRNYSDALRRQSLITMSWAASEVTIHRTMHSA
ncbi:MAG: hypothetical protein ACKN9U_17650, partial [Pirellulaceae bacterium]